MTTIEHLDGMRRLADSYDGMIVDLWGVVHNGVALLPGVADCLASLRRAGKRVVFLSNAPRRASVAADGLARMGLDPALHDGVLTSGEVTRDLLITRADPFVASLGPRVFHLGPAKDANVLEDAGREIAATLAGADFVLNTGPDDDRPEALGHYRAILEEAAALRLPMLCANPDLVVVRGTTTVICAGTLARIYADELGGAVRVIGKPDPIVYPPVLARLGTEKSRTLAVGDALATDIAGAAASGIDAAWVLGGIHADLAGRPDEAARLACTAGLTPRAILPAFNW